jgi:succinate dehydrogenase / fumarate reductase membrane anchor subunit
MVARVAVGAHYGWRDWLVQRVTAVVMAVYALILAAVLLRQPSMDFSTWRGLWATPWLRYATLLFFLSLAWHAWVGMRDILMDYVGNAGWRVALQSAVILALVCYTVWAMRILWGF